MLVIGGVLIVGCRKTVLIMDEVDGMSGGDRGGIADLIASIKSSHIPIICLCNYKYSQLNEELSFHRFHNTFF